MRKPSDLCTPKRENSGERLCHQGDDDLAFRYAERERSISSVRRWIHRSKFLSRFPLSIPASPPIRATANRLASMQLARVPEFRKPHPCADSATTFCQPDPGVLVQLTGPKFPLNRLGHGVSLCPRWAVEVLWFQQRFSHSRTQLSVASPR